MALNFIILLYIYYNTQTIFKNASDQFKTAFNSIAHTAKDSSKDLLILRDYFSEILNKTNASTVRVPDIFDNGMYRFADDNYSWLRELLGKYGIIIYKKEDINEDVDTSPLVIDRGDNDVDEDEDNVMIIRNDDTSGFGVANHEDGEEFDCVY